MAKIKANEALVKALQAWDMITCMVFQETQSTQ